MGPPALNGTVLELLQQELFPGSNNDNKADGVGERTLMESLTLASDMAHAVWGYEWATPGREVGR